MTRRRWAAATVVVAILVAGAWLVLADDDDDGEVPSPLFGDVEQLTPTALPDGWARCGGERSRHSDATDEWWAQSFGPADDGDCTPLVTVTQVPPDDHVDLPQGATNGGIGEEPGRTGAKHWSDPDAGTRGLYTSAFGQRLIVEACCGDAATGDAFDQVAEAARDATREQEPARCTAPHSDLDRESFLTNFFARQQRASDDDSCPVRGDIVSWRTEPPTAHCFAGVVFLVVGAPVGAPFDLDDPAVRRYTRDPEGDLDSRDAPNPPPDLAAELPDDAVDTGFRLGDAALWIDDSDDAFVYVVDGEIVEAWPRDRRPHVCA